MTEIKFACPYCRQHIACDEGYADLWIECPSCAGTLVVPRLTATDSKESGAVIVAVTPAPKPRPTSRLPTLDPWTEEKWAQHSHEMTGESPWNNPAWAVLLFATLVVAVVLRVAGAGLGPMVGCLLIGGLLAGILMANAKSASGTRAVLTGLAIVAAAVVLLPMIALGVLFVGCTCGR
jgi:hypothetical protein